MAEPKKKTKQDETVAPEIAATERFCSFCKKSSKNFYRMISAPPGPDEKYEVFICDECVNVCVQLLMEESSTPLWIPVVSQHNVFAEYLGTKRDFPAATIHKNKWQIAYLAPQGKQFDNIFSAHIAPNAEGKSLTAYRLKGVYGKRKSISEIMKKIYEAAIVIADVSGKDPDVMYVLGMVHLIGKPLVILSQDPADIPADLKKDRRIIYENTAKGLKLADYHLSHIFIFIRHELKADEILPDNYKSGEPLNYPDPPMPRQKKAKQ
jgi:hypothetical protein